MKPAFTHCALHVSDLDKSIAFYRSYCGLEIVKEHGEGDGRAVWLASPGEAKNFVLVLLGGGPRREQDKKRHDPLRFRRRVPRGHRRHCRARAERRLSSLGAARLCAADRLSLRGQGPDQLYNEFSFGQPLGPHQE